MNQPTDTPKPPPAPDGDPELKRPRTGPDHEDGDVR